MVDQYNPFAHLEQLNEKPQNTTDNLNEKPLNKPLDETKNELKSLF
jgi:hypothetical protein